MCVEILRGYENCVNKDVVCDVTREDSIVVDVDGFRRLQRQLFCRIYQRKVTVNKLRKTKLWRWRPSKCG